jgi:cold shock CspA family protein
VSITKEGGVILWYDAGRGIGFVLPDSSPDPADRSKNLFFHVSGVLSGVPRKGARVSFSRGLTKRGGVGATMVEVVAG